MKTSDQKNRWFGFQHGFSLIEIMIVLVIFVIIFLIAMPSYQQYLKRQYRIACQAEMMRIAAKVEMNMLYVGNYKTVVSDVFSQDMDFPLDEKMPKYKIKVMAAESFFQILATPQHSQIDDGRMTYDAFGKRCWYQGFDQNGGVCQAW